MGEGSGTWAAVVGTRNPEVQLRHAPDSVRGSLILTFPEARRWSDFDLPRVRKRI